MPAPYMRAGTNDPASDAAQASRDHTSLFRQRLRHILAEQPDSRKGGRPRWAALLLPAYILRWIANTLLRRRGLKTVELELEEATGQYATIFPEPVRARSPVARIRWELFCSLTHASGGEQPGNNLAPFPSSGRTRKGIREGHEFRRGK